jgi:hypothetical protein
MRVPPRASPRARASHVAAALTALAALALDGRAHADACRDVAGHLRAPIAIGSEGADFGAAAPACAANRVGLDLRADAAIAADAPDFYGDLRGALLASASWAPSDRVWLDAAWDAGRYDFVANASIVAKGAGTGPITLGAHAVLERGARFQVAPFVRALLPLESGWSHAFRIGLETGIAAIYALSPRWAVHGSASYPLQTTWLGRRVAWRFTPRAAVDVSYAPLRWLELLLGGEARLTADPDGSLDALGARAAARFHLGRGVELHLEAVLPFAGFDRTDARLALGGAVRW